MSENGGIGHVFSRVDLNWRHDGDAWAVRYRSRVLLQVVPDETYPGMWRIQHPDGWLSDMVNLSRAKDAAIGLAVGILNADKRRRWHAAGAREGGACYPAPSETENAPEPAVRSAGFADAVDDREHGNAVREDNSITQMSIALYYTHPR